MKQRAGPFAVVPNIPCGQEDRPTMWATLAFVTALGLAPHQSGDLKLTNVRATYGMLGATRTDNEFLPGDIYFVAFDMENLDVTEDGRVLYSMGMELLDSKGKAVFAKEPQDLEARNDLGGRTMPGFAASEVGTETPQGDYTLKVTVTDRRSKKSDTLTRKFKVLPRDFGLVRAHMAYFAQAPVPAPPLFVVGQAAVVNCGAVGFTRADKGQMQPNIALEMVVLDDQGSPTLKQPITDEVKMNVPKNLSAIPISLPIQMNRPGKFTIKITAQDKLANKKSTVSIPIQVVETKETK
jgi:hypothetical protein